MGARSRWAFLNAWPLPLHGRAEGCIESGHWALGLAPQVAAVISQPGKPKGRGNKSMPVPSAVEQLARDMGVGDDRIRCPATAKDVSGLRL